MSVRSRLFALNRPPDVGRGVAGRRAGGSGLRSRIGASAKKGAMIGLVLTLLGFTFNAHAAQVEKKRPVVNLAIGKLAWLAGSWRFEKNSQVVDEQWMVPGGGVMLGMVRTLEKSKVRGFAFLQIREGPGGSLFFVQQGSGQKEVAFQSKTLTDTAVVFLNQLEDFPQTISYTLKSDGSLIEAEEGTGTDGQPKRIEVVYRRIGQ